MLLYLVGYLNEQIISHILDFVRLTAALLVFISHVPDFAGGWLWQFAGMGHEAVVVFLSCLALLFPMLYMSEKTGRL